MSIAKRSVHGPAPPDPLAATLVVVSPAGRARRSRSRDGARRVRRLEVADRRSRRTVGRTPQRSAARQVRQVHARTRCRSEDILRLRGSGSRDRGQGTGREPDARKGAARLQAVSAETEEGERLATGTGCPGRSSLEVRQVHARTRRQRARLGVQWTHPDTSQRSGRRRRPEPRKPRLPGSAESVPEPAAVQGQGRSGRGAEHGQEHGRSRGGAPAPALPCTLAAER
jgi:hypothetical protein